MKKVKLQPPAAGGEPETDQAAELEFSEAELMKFLTSQVDTVNTVPYFKAKE